jgi:hypothetical protein
VLHFLLLIIVVTTLQLQLQWVKSLLRLLSSSKPEFDYNMKVVRKGDLYLLIETQRNTPEKFRGVISVNDVLN